jgi:hypothetical protein
MEEGSLWEALKVRPSARQKKQLERIRKELSGIGPCLPGTLNIRTGRCGKTRCKCHEDPARLHGPFLSWTRKVAGKTVTRLLTDEQLDDYQELFDNHRRLKDLVHELEELSLEIADDDDRWMKR